MCSCRGEIQGRGVGGDPRDCPGSNLEAPASSGGGGSPVPVSGCRRDTPGLGSPGPWICEAGSAGGGEAPGTSPPCQAPASTGEARGEPLDGVPERSLSGPPARAGQDPMRRPAQAAAGIGDHPGWEAHLPATPQPQKRVAHIPKGQRGCHCPTRTKKHLLKCAQVLKEQHTEDRNGKTRTNGTFRAESVRWK